MNFYSHASSSLSSSHGTNRTDSGETFYENLYISWNIVQDVFF